MRIQPYSYNFSLQSSNCFLKDQQRLRTSCNRYNFFPKSYFYVKLQVRLLHDCLSMYYSIDFTQLTIRRRAWYCLGHTDRFCHLRHKILTIRIFGIVDSSTGAYCLPILRQPKKLYLQKSRLYLKRQICSNQLCLMN